MKKPVLKLSVCLMAFDSDGRILLVRSRANDRGFELPTEKLKPSDTSLAEAACRGLNEESGGGLHRKDIQILTSSKKLGIVTCAFFNQLQNKLILGVKARVQAVHSFKPTEEIRAAQWFPIKRQANWRDVVSSDLARDRVSLYLNCLSRSETRLLCFEYHSGKPARYQKLSNSPLTLDSLQDFGVNAKLLDVPALDR